MTEIPDRGALLGDGLFETLLWEGGRLVDFSAHARRLILGCAALGLAAPSEAQMRSAALEVARTVAVDRAAVRLTWSALGGRGLERPEPCPGRLVGSASPAPEGRAPARLATAAIRRNASSPAARLKTLSYLDNVLARRQARQGGADEALMLNAEGEICGGAAANLFWFEGATLVTPALACGVLAGTVRARVLAQAAELGLHAREAHAPASALTAATGLFLTNSLIGVRPVANLDGRPVPAHPLVARLDQALTPRASI
ncbi:MAG TPA: aminotransferase class IV [Caulobacteraceae bacterium]|jgi:branched-chain amino acid aminotransferase/4-amino-4-deoxychorismate lyase